MLRTDVTSAMLRRRTHAHRLSSTSPSHHLLPSLHTHDAASSSCIPRRYWPHLSGVLAVLLLAGLGIAFLAAARTAATGTVRVRAFSALHAQQLKETMQLTRGDAGRGLRRPAEDEDEPGDEDYHHTPSGRATYDVTLVSHSSPERLEVFRRLTMHWRGPMSVALLVREDDESQKLARQWQAVVDEDAALQARVALTMVPQAQVPPPRELLPSDEKEAQRLAGLYPHNYLRNVAFEAVRTPLAFVVDLDLMPSRDLYARLRAQPELLAEIVESQESMFLVVPAIEVGYERSGERITQEEAELAVHEFDQRFPASVDEAKQAVRDGSMRGFHADLYFPSYGATDYERWATSTSSYAIDYKEGFEPYGIVRVDIARFDEEFRGYGFNYSSWVSKLAIAGLPFRVFSDGFCVHLDHVQGTNLLEDRNLRLRFGWLDRLPAGVPPAFTKDWKTYDPKFITLALHADADTQGMRSMQRLAVSLNRHLDWSMVGSVVLIVPESFPAKQVKAFRQAPDLAHWPHVRVFTESELVYSSIDASLRPACKGKALSKLVSLALGNVVQTEHVLYVNSQTVLGRPLASTSLRASDFRSTDEKAAPAWDAVQPGWLMQQLYTLQWRGKGSPAGLQIRTFRALRQVRGLLDLRPTAVDFRSVVPAPYEWHVPTVLSRAGLRAVQEQLRAFYAKRHPAAALARTLWPAVLCEHVLADHTGQEPWDPTWLHFLHIHEQHAVLVRPSSQSTVERSTTAYRGFLQRLTGKVLSPPVVLQRSSQPQSWPSFDWEQAGTVWWSRHLSDKPVWLSS